MSQRAHFRGFLGREREDFAAAEYYAAPGRVTLTTGDLLHTTPTVATPEANRSVDQLVENFLALRMTYPPTDGDIKTKRDLAVLPFSSGRGQAARQGPRDFSKVAHE